MSYIKKLWSRSDKRTTLKFLGNCLVRHKAINKFQYYLFLGLIFLSNKRCIRGSKKPRWMGLSECSGGCPILIFVLIFFLLKKIEFVPWLTQTLVYYWQEIFLLTLTPDSEAIPSWYYCIFCRLNWTIEHVINLNKTWPVFIFVLISFVHMRGAIDEIKHVYCKSPTQFVIFKPLSYWFKETIGFDAKASFASRP